MSSNAEYINTANYISPWGEMMGWISAKTTQQKTRPDPTDWAEPFPSALTGALVMKSTDCQPSANGGGGEQEGRK